MSDDGIRSKWRIRSVRTEQDQVMNGPRVTGLSLRYVVTIDAIEAEHPGRIAARVAIAPEMEALLRRLGPAITTASLDQNGDYVHTPANDALGLLHAEFAGLLARIDATWRKG
jgi:hypothetical protein